MTLFAGGATVEITPKPPVPMSGYGAREEPASGVNDPLEAAALVLADGATTVGIISTDLLNVSRPLVTGVEERLAAAGIALDELVLAATHTHGGPYVPAPAIDVHPTLSVEEDVSDVVADIADGVVEATATAHDRLEPATLRVGTATTDAVVNRRADLGARLPSDAVDPTVSAILIEGRSGTETVLFHLACHAVSIGAADTLLTADWPGVARRAVAAARGDDPTVLFCNGAAGDVTTRGRNDGQEDGYVYAEAVGREIAADVGRAVADAEESSPAGSAPILTDRRRLRLPVKDAPERSVLRERERELESTREGLRADGHDDAARRYGRDLSYVRELLAIEAWSVSHLPARLRYVEVGPLGALAVPGEAFVEHGLAFEATAAADTLLTVGYADDYVGYLPTLRELENWGYEVRTTKVAPEAIPAFREAGCELVDGTGTR